MYQKKVPYKDYRGNPRTETIYLNLDEREVFKLLVEFQGIFEWRESLGSEEDRDLTAEETVEFYNNLEEILLSAYGVPSDDGRHFDKVGRYKFESSKLFNECILMFLRDPQEANKMVDALVPEGMQEMIKTADANLVQAAKSEDTPEALRRQIERLQAQVKSTETAD